MWRCIPIDVSLGSWSGEAQRSSLATEGAPPDGLSDVTRAGIEQLASGYDATRHGHSSATHAQQLEDDFIDRFAVTGPAKEVGERLAGWPLSDSSELSSSRARSMPIPRTSRRATPGSRRTCFPN
jgi:hypothetical protein